MKKNWREKYKMENDNKEAASVVIKIKIITREE